VTRAPTACLLAAALAAGCAGGRPPVPGPVAAARAAGDAAARLAAGHRQRAEALEAAGRLRQAREEWRIALTIEPLDAGARAREAELAARIATAARARVAEGREALARGALLEARRHFLAALALDPGQPAALAALADVQEVRVVVHTVRAGETLAGVAERYYRDPTRAAVIRETNRLRSAVRLPVGIKLRIPELPGVPFLPADAAGRPPVAETPEVNPLVAEVREALDREDWAAALADAERLIAANPQQPEGLELKKAALYGLGKGQLAARRVGEAYETLRQLVRLAPEYRDGASLLAAARDRLVREHYSEGLRLYRDERLEEAIAEWRAALELDPQHANARRNLEQAERVLQGLQQRRRAPARPGG